MSKNYQKQAALVGTDAELVLPEAVTVAMAEIGGAVREGLLALAVATGLQVMTLMMDESVTALAGPRGRHQPDRAAVRHGSEAGSVILGGRRASLPPSRPAARAHICLIVRETRPAEDGAGGAARSSPTAGPAPAPRSAGWPAPSCSGEDAILAWHTTGYTNGPVEGLNSLIKKIKRVAAGFRSFTNYRLRILLAVGGCTWDLLGTPPH
jgi:Transposase